MARWLVGFLVLFGCVDKGPGPQGKKIEQSYVREHLVRDVPADVVRADVALGDKVIYVGNRVDVTSVAPGQTVRVTHYWRVLAPLGDHWRVFALVRGAPNSADFMNLGATDMEIGHPPATWQPGELIEDVQDITLRPDWRSKTATLSVGLIQTGGHDVGDRMVASGGSVVDRAVTARVFDVDLSRAPPPPGTVYIPRAVGPITIDGVATDQGWGAAATSPEFVTAEGVQDPLGRTVAKLTWDDQYLYVFVQVTDTDIVSPYKNHDDPLWKADAIEIFIDADGNRRGYIELQVNPNNATFDKWWPGTRAQEGDEKWDSGMVTAVKLRGTTAEGDTDQGWDAEIAIPWAAVKGADENMKVRLPPEVGDRWRMNIVRPDVRTGGKGAANGGVSSWSRITRDDFHALDRMLTVVFADSAGSIVPKPVVAPEAGSGSGGGGSGSGSGSGSGNGGGTGSGSGSGSGSGIIMAPRIR
ncbi:MAG TPA: carbohydrate-binding family 9-like protein [Kofleriaceae bacterium]|nr:carbohydrate-binding family 9-like protein [Kofleriaceae bacterium]